jgi:uncharacterized membrane protein YgcG
MYFKSNFFILLLFIFFAFLPGITFAKAYNYEDIDVTMQVNTDATVDIKEKNTLHFNGDFHFVYRDIPKTKMDGISDISLHSCDGFKYKYAGSKDLDKDSPESFGKYLIQKNFTYTRIKWYYTSSSSDDITDWNRCFVLNYKAHGVVGFYKDKDELYWNLFTDYSEPVSSVSGRVILSWEVPEENIQKTLYIDNTQDAQEDILKGGNVTIWRFNPILSGPIPPHGKATIAIGWPRGFVDRVTYWRRDFLVYNYGYILFILSILFAIGRYVLVEIIPKRRQTIIPQYNPPHDFSPAIMDLILNEKITKRTWPGTIVHMATRGLIKIQEFSKEDYKKYSPFGIGKNIFINIIAITIPYIITSFIFVIPLMRNNGFIDQDLKYVLYIILITIFIAWIFSTRKQLHKKDYKIEKLVSLTQDNTIQYEKKFINTLFRYGGKGGVFTTAALKGSHSSSMQQDFKSLRKRLEKDTISRFPEFTINLTMERNYRIVIFIASFIAFFLLVFTGVVAALGLNIILVFASLIIVSYTLTETRLTNYGNKIYAEILGFKMYLKTAERYRLQNLTPETFEDFLPYAMVFGVEKEWAKAFETANVQLNQPTWYSNGNSGISTGGQSGFNSTAFSATAFSASLASSFSSSVSSSGAGGASGGGGSGGGGSGGGGGGAG